METFPDVDFPMTVSSPPPVMEPGGLFVSHNPYIPPAAENSTDFIGDFGTMLASPFVAIKDTASGVVESVTSTVRNMYFYLIGGVAIIGILAIILLGASSRFMGRMDGGN